jgi:CRISPR-associated protein Cas1
MEVVENTLFVTSDRSYLRLDHDTVVVEPEEGEKKTLPLLAFGGIVCFGDIMLSPALLRRCAEDGRTVTYLDFAGRFKARMEGPVSGNVLLRQAQFRALDSPERTLDLAMSFVLGKLQNGRQNLLRAGREAKDETDAAVLQSTSHALGDAIRQAANAPSVDWLRGVEGDAARKSFAAWKHMVLVEREVFGISSRSRRPPLDPSNALLSFLYTLLAHDCRSALEGVGLDPQAGYLHVLRSGRPALALDLMEELRPLLGDRLALTLINRRQVTSDDFVTRPGGAVMFKDAARKVVLTAFIERKREEIQHPSSGRKIPLGLVVHLQARLLARTIRGELEHYPPFLYR